VERQGDVFDAGERGEEVEELEDEADFVAAEAGEVVIGEVGDGLAVDTDFPGGGTVEAADEVEEVDFPEPEGPTMETISPRAICRSTESRATTCLLPLKCLETPERAIIRYLDDIARVEASGWVLCF